MSFSGLGFTALGVFLLFRGSRIHSCNQGLFSVHGLVFRLFGTTSQPSLAEAGSENGF